MNKINNKSERDYYIKEDFSSYEMKYPIISRFTYGENWELFSFVKTVRYLEYYSNKKQYPWNKIMKFYYWIRYRKLCRDNGIYLPVNSAGPGLHFVHRGFRHILSSTQIGKNCTILPNVLIGKKTPEYDNCEIIIGDDCYISTGVTILGPVKIGNGVTIAAGAVVNKDVPDNCIVGGVPAKILKYKTI